MPTHNRFLEEAIDALPEDLIRRLAYLQEVSEQHRDRILSTVKPEEARAALIKQGIAAEHAEAYQPTLRLTGFGLEVLQVCHRRIFPDPP